MGKQRETGEEEGERGRRQGERGRREAECLNLNTPHRTDCSNFSIKRTSTEDCRLYFNSEALGKGWRVLSLNDLKLLEPCSHHSEL